MNNININNIFTNDITYGFINLPNECEESNLSKLNNSTNSNGKNKQNNKSTQLIGNFSVDSLVQSNTFKSSITDDYIINKIKFNKQNEIIKIANLYETNYKECLLKINNAIELNLTDIIFSVGITYFGFNNYNPTECVDYLEKKLREKNFLTLKISYKDIFVSWKHIINDIK